MKLAKVRLRATLLVRTRSQAALILALPAAGYDALIGSHRWAPPTTGYFRRWKGLSQLNMWVTSRLPVVRKQVLVWGLMSNLASEMSEFKLLNPFSKARRGTPSLFHYLNVVILRKLFPREMILCHKNITSKVGGGESSQKLHCVRKRIGWRDRGNL